MTSPVLAVPEGWVVDPLSEAILRRALAAADDSCSGVVARRVDLAPGSSYRVAAERAALSSSVPPVSPVPPSARGSIEGAVLLRPGVPHLLEDDGVVVDAALLADARSVSFDPWRPTGPLAPASREGRPPFPRRPVVLFLGLEVDPDLADWARATVNGLVRGDTEGRLAVPSPTGGLHLTRPCLPEPASVAALAPDVVVALDGRAGRVAQEWLGEDRGATVVQLTEDTSAEVELVSWRIDRARGRLRGRIGRGVQPAAVEQLVRRLCAGPQPAPPRDRDQRGGTGLSLRPRVRLRPQPRPSMAVLVCGTSSAARARFSNLAEHAPAAGVDVRVHPWPEGGVAPAGEVDVLVVQGGSGRRETMELVAARRAAGSATVVDLGPAELEPAGGTGLVLTPAARQLVRSAGLATAAGPRASAAARGAGAASLVLPTFLAPERVANLQHLRTREATDGPPRLGWHTGAAGAQVSDVDAAVAATIRSLLDARPELLVEVVGGVDHVVHLLPDHPRLRLMPGAPGSHQVATWTAQLWTASPAGAEVDGETRPVIEAHLLGVPTFAAVEHPSVADGLVPPGLAIADSTSPAAWEPVAALLGDPRARARRSIQVQDLADGLYGPTAGACFLNRLVGWASRERPT